MTQQQAVIFDMDGVIIDSEHLWQAAEKIVFARIGITLTTAMCCETIGLRMDQVIRYWYDRQPWDSKSAAQVEAELFTEVQALILAEGAAMPGLYEILGEIHKSNLKVAIASSSPRKLIESVVIKLELSDYFESIYSGFDVPHGKPDPAVYLAAADGLGVTPTNCVAIEDSLAGIQSAKGAGIRVIAVPESGFYDNPKFDIADMKIKSLTQLDLGIILRMLN
jgi:mannitol-1-/sugar-/sorbitol-6-/2-deoxyglucose-6-phosphatase